MMGVDGQFGVGALQSFAGVALRGAPPPPDPVAWGCGQPRRRGPLGDLGGSFASWLGIPDKNRVPNGFGPHLEIHAG